MGELRIGGAEALAFLRYALVSDPGTLEPGQAQYSMLCAADGGIIDDLIVYRDGPGYLIVCNASNREAVTSHLADLQARGDFEATVDDESDRTALIAPQGPNSAALLAQLTDLDLAGLANYHSMRGKVAGLDCLVARTGYTGEDGFELGSRDTLRLEAAMPLYGNELDRSVNPYEANLGRVVKMEKGEFVGRSALAAVQQTGPRRRLVGLQMREDAIARHGYPVRVAGEEAGTVTSGTLSPTLGERIAMAYLPAAAAAIGAEVEVVVRERPYRAEQVKLPFYRRPKPDAA
jgi:aminomethyltransferase